jgi:hypothetical protein
MRGNMTLPSRVLKQLTPGEFLLLVSFSSKEQISGRKDCMHSQHSNVCELTMDL